MTDVNRLLTGIEDPTIREELARILERRGHTHRQLYLPEIKDQLRLVKPWTFMLHNHHLNTSLWQALEIKLTEGGNVGGRWVRPSPVEVTLPVDTILTVDRIYIRQGKSEYSSVTFRSIIEGVKKKPRFWAKLEDVNRIYFEPVKEN